MRHAEHVTRLAPSFAGGDPPDLFLINYRRWGQFLGGEVLAPPGPWLDDLASFKRTDFFDLTLEAFSWNGELLRMPQNASSLVVYWNRALFNRYDVPTPDRDRTWREFHDAAASLTRDTGLDRRNELCGLDLDPSIV